MLLNDEKIGKNKLKGASIKDAVFSNCDFSGADLTDTEFLNCRFYDRDTQKACRFNRSILKDASFKNCDLSMVDFRHSQALGLEIRECLAQGADFRGASFMNLITAKTWFCSAYITKSNLSYANFSGVILEKCELWENRWHETTVIGSVFRNSDLSGGEFSSFNWSDADFTGCDLTNSQLGALDIRRVDFSGVKLNEDQIFHLIDSLGIIVVGNS
ncbi:Qnr family pentapeptide repeat protein [Providencia sp. wls1943]|uniref:Qnr family pentapeptide repeat protein n=1 Tax=Providencia sp. wls1943 TaxID=2675150 RepID=UPI0012B5C029|nr:Qnr family pentapeptide repeat protein [Providencia sp. wls1943]MTB67226.1 Qnr family pentapeptide repeat protein [Providencia sp. wls1943]